MAVLFFDDYNDRNNVPLGSNYTAFSGPTAGGMPEIVNNRVDNDAVGSRGAYVATSVVTFPNDQYAQAKIYPLHTASLWVRAIVTGGEMNGYVFFAKVGDTAISINKYKNNAGYTATLDSDTLASPVASGDVLYLKASGSTITAKINGVTVLTGSDSEFTSGQPGLACFTGAGSGVLDDFEAGDLTAGSTIIRAVRRIRSGGLLSVRGICTGGHL